MSVEKKPSIPLPPIRIEVLKTFKSVGDVDWPDVPGFAVLTGLNGSGKTQLLELLAHSLSDTPHGTYENLKDYVRITGDTIGPDSVAYLSNQWQVGGAPLIGIAEMQQAKRQLHQEMRQGGGDVRVRVKRARIQALLGVSPSSIDVDTFIARLPDDFTFMLEETDVVSGLVHVFVAHRVRAAQEREKGTLEIDLEKKIGPAPWDVMNEILRVAEFPYRVVSPLTKGLLEPYDLKLIDQQTQQEVRPYDLSSGEKTLFALVVWLYNSQHHGKFPRLFLMDEPDAHLHPSMTRHFLNVIKEVLVDRFAVRVILSTHSPSTVALAPEGCIFEMSRTKPRIRSSKSKADSIGLLTAGLVIVSRTTKYVLVEDDDDVDFYGAVRDMLCDYGPSKDARPLKPTPTLVFLPASSGAGKTKIGGGSSVVYGWVAKLDVPPLDQLMRGIVDRDTANPVAPRVQIIGRYSIENYLLDPFVVFAVLLDQGTSAAVAVTSVTQGDEHTLRLLDNDNLQKIVDGIQSVVEKKLSSLTPQDKVHIAVSFTNGKAVKYPTWMLERRGHDLLPIYQSAFGGPGVISPPRLYRALKRVRLIPSELAEILHGLQI